VSRAAAGLIVGLMAGFVAGVLVAQSADAAPYKPPEVLAAHGERVNDADNIGAEATPAPVHTPLRPHLYDYRGEQAALAYLRESNESERQTAEHDAQVAAAEQARERAARAARPAPGPPRAESIPHDDGLNPAIPHGSVWDRLAACESGGNWAANTGNGYYGGLQFSVRSWAWVGGTGLPHEHSRATQIAMGERLLARQGWGAWPSCSRKLRLR
jgi:hypothetical protein